MSMIQAAMGTAAFKGPAAITAVALDRFKTQIMLVAVATLSTSAPAPAAVTRYEDTALHIGPRVSGPTRIIERQAPASIKRIDDLACYGAGWNGPDSIGPTIETVRQAKAFAYQLATLGSIAQPYISVADDGEINFYWNTKSGFQMDLGFTGVSKYSYFAQTLDGREFIEDGADLGDFLPDELITALRA